MKSAKELVEAKLETGNYDYLAQEGAREFFLDDLTALLHLYGEEVKKECEEIADTYCATTEVHCLVAGKINELKLK